MPSAPPTADGKSQSSPLGPAEVLDAYFLETRAKLLEIAATLDRLDRAAAAHPDAPVPADDRRLIFVHNALDLLRQATGPIRAEAIQRLYSLE